MEIEHASCSIFKTFVCKRYFWFCLRTIKTTSANFISLLRDIQGICSFHHRIFHLTIQEDAVLHLQLQCALQKGKLMRLPVGYCFVQQKFSSTLSDSLRSTKITSAFLNCPPFPVTRTPFHYDIQG